MSAIAQVALGSVPGAITATRTILGASDTLTYSQGTGQMLVLYNTTASPVIVTLLGNSVTAISPPGYGGTVSVAAGTAQTVPATSTLVVPLDKFSAFLTGTSVAVTNGTGVTAHMYA